MWPIIYPWCISCRSLMILDLTVWKLWAGHRKANRQMDGQKRHTMIQTYKKRTLSVCVSDLKRILKIWLPLWSNNSMFLKILPFLWGKSSLHHHHTQASIHHWLDQSHPNWSAPRYSTNQNTKLKRIICNYDLIRKAGIICLKNTSFLPHFLKFSPTFIFATLGQNAILDN